MNELAHPPSHSPPSPSADASAAPAHVLTPHVALKRVVMLVNPLSGSVGPRAADEARTLLEAYELEAKVIVLSGDFDAHIAEAFADNLEDEAVLLSVSTDSARNFFGSYGAPRTVGVKAGFKFN